MNVEIRVKIDLDEERIDLLRDFYCGVRSDATIPELLRVVVLESIARELDIDDGEARAAYGIIRECLVEVA